MADDSSGPRGMGHVITSRVLRCKYATTSIFPSATTGRIQKLLKDAKATDPNLLAYVDDGKIYVSSPCLYKNTQILRELYLWIEQWGSRIGVKFDKEKKEMMHYTRRNKDKDICPSMSIPMAADGTPAHTVIGLRENKWLGTIFDRKLTFKSHVAAMATKGENALKALRMLSNTRRGLKQPFLRTLYTTCVQSILTYGSAVWWRDGAPGSKGLLEMVDKVQRKAIRWICGSFKTTPIRAMEVEAAVLPMKHHLNLINRKYAIRLNKLDWTHPMIQRLGNEWRFGEQAWHPPPIPLQRPRERSRKTTRLTDIAALSDPTWERILPFHAAPWRRTQHDMDIRGRITIRLKATPDETKEAAAKRHNKEIQAIESSPDHILVYTDGSQTYSKELGIRAGAGMIAYKEKQELWSSPHGLGPDMEVYDAEMAGLGIASKTVIEASLAAEAGMEAKEIHFFADNSGSIQTIFEEKPKSGQIWSIIFKAWALKHLDKNRENTINLTWVPGHQDVAGNEASDELAKEATSMPYSTYKSLTNAKREARRIVLKQWTDEYRGSPGGSFALADRFKPAFKPKPHFESLPRALYALVTQVRTGHAFTGEYYSRFVPTEDTSCGCGVNPQTRAHVLQDCALHEEHRDILREASPGLKIADILGTPKGIDALASFIQRSGAFKKAR